MKQRFIKHSTEARNLILVFAGWSTDHTLYQDLEREGWDLMVCYDFDDFNFDASLVAQYSTIYLYAWSLGVCAASRALKGVNITAAFAINGTLTPVNTETGIPDDIYFGTLNGLSDHNLRKFQNRIFSSLQLLRKTLPQLPQYYDIPALKQQLEFIANESRKESPGHVNWTRVYISDEDRIFPPANQLRAWQDHPDVKIMKGKPHFADLKDIARHTIPDTSRNAARFLKSLFTYDQNAIAQRRIANHLVRMLGNIPLHIGGQVLEIGPGSGIFTFLYMPLLRPAKAVFIELYAISRFYLAPSEAYYVADAEELMCKDPANGLYDYVLSASAIQWFANQRLFFRNVARRLKDDGVFACSSFLPGNLQELDEVRMPMVYASRETLKKNLEEFFEDVQIEEETLAVKFESARDAIIHLSRTGVGGSASVNTISQLTAAIPKDENGCFYLTYRPVYFIARKPRKIE